MNDVELKSKSNPNAQKGAEKSKQETRPIYVYDPLYQRGHIEQMPCREEQKPLNYRMMLVMSAGGVEVSSYIEVMARSRSEAVLVALCNHFVSLDAKDILSLTQNVADGASRIDYSGDGWGFALMDFRVWGDAGGY